MRWATEAIILLLATTIAASTIAGEYTFQSGNWRVYRFIDPMTDNTNCVLVQSNGQTNASASRYSLYIHYMGRGGIQSYRLRIDDAAPGRYIRAKTAEIQTSTLILKDDTFRRLLRATRLRVETYTALRDIIIDDIDLTGLSASHDRMIIDCYGAQGVPLPVPRPEEIGGSNEHPLMESFREFGDSDHPSTEMDPPVDIQQYFRHSMPQRQ